DERTHAACGDLVFADARSIRERCGRAAALMLRPCLACFARTARIATEVSCAAWKLNALLRVRARIRRAVFVLQAALIVRALWGFGASAVDVGLVTVLHFVGG